MSLYQDVAFRCPTGDDDGNDDNRLIAYEVRPLAEVTPDDLVHFHTPFFDDQGYDDWKGELRVADLDVLNVYEFLAEDIVDSIPDFRQELERARRAYDALTDSHSLAEGEQLLMDALMAKAAEVFPSECDTVSESGIDDAELDEHFPDPDSAPPTHSKPSPDCRVAADKPLTTSSSPAQSVPPIYQAAALIPLSPQTSPGSYPASSSAYTSATEETDSIADSLLEKHLGEGPKDNWSPSFITRQSFTGPKSPFPQVDASIFQGTPSLAKSIPGFAEWGSKQPYGALKGEVNDARQIPTIPSSGPSLTLDNTPSPPTSTNSTIHSSLAGFTPIVTISTDDLPAPIHACLKRRREDNEINPQEAPYLREQRRAGRL